MVLQSSVPLPDGCVSLPTHLQLIRSAPPGHVVGVHTGKDHWLAAVGAGTWTRATCSCWSRAAPRAGSPPCSSGTPSSPLGASRVGTGPCCISLRLLCVLKTGVACTSQHINQHFACIAVPPHRSSNPCTMPCAPRLLHSACKHVHHTSCQSCAHKSPETQPHHTSPPPPPSVSRPPPSTPPCARRAQSAGRVWAPRRRTRATCCA